MKTKKVVSGKWSVVSKGKIKNLIGFFVFLLVTCNLSLVTYPLLSVQAQTPTTASAAPCSGWEPGMLLPKNCKPDGVVGSDKVTYNISGIRSTVNSYITYLLPVMAVVAVFLIVRQALTLIAYSSNDAKLKEAFKNIQWILIGLLGATLAYMIITGIIGAFYNVASY